MDDFEERAGAGASATSFGRWLQTLDEVRPKMEVTVEVDVPPGTRGKDVKVDVRAENLHVSVGGKVVLDGRLSGRVVADEALWTIEDGTLLRIVLVKGAREAGNAWASLLQDQFHADPLEHDTMQKKLTLERFQRENPGMDFSGAEVTGNYHDGGPQFPEA